MNDQRPLVYHQATLDLLHERPAVSEEAAELLEQFSHLSNLVLPASVREWYTLPQAVTWLSTYSNQDHPVPLELLGDIDGFGDDAVDLAQQGLVPIMVENQHVCIWALRLDGTEDPPVVVSFDATTGWQPYAERFSTFVYVQIWDYQGIFSDYTLWGETLFSSDELSFLQAHFTEEPQTLTHPTPLTRRFSRGTQRILLWCGDEPMAQWFLSATTEEEWSRLMHTMESCETLAQQLPHFQPFDS